MSDSSRVWVARGSSPMGKIVLGNDASPTNCPNCGRAVDESRVVFDLGSQAKFGVAGNVETAVCPNELCRASLARVRTLAGDAGSWTAVVAITNPDEQPPASSRD